MKIGVFDSGIGGLSIAQAIGRDMPEHEVVFRNDSAHVPYGTRPTEEIKRLCEPIIRSLIEEGCTVIVIACNTVSALLASDLRASFDVPFIALDPMVKPAAVMTKTNVIAVCATPATLGSQRYRDLKEEFAADCTIIEPDCSDWSAMIEHDTVDDAIISERINDVLGRQADVIVLACTHYHWIEHRIKELAGDNAVVLQPEEAIIRRLRHVIERLS